MTILKLDRDYEPLRFIPVMDLDVFVADAPRIREVMLQFQSALPKRQSDRLIVEDREIETPHGRLGLRVYRPRSSGSKGALLYFHGGGYIVGNLDSEHGRCVDYADLGDCVVVSVDYRLAPEFVFPSQHDDGWAALNWLVSQAQSLNVDPSKIAVGGGSAGAALAAGLALRARDEGSPSICFALLVQPVVDSRAGSYSARTFNDTPFLKGSQLPGIWKLYLGSPPPTGKQLSYAAALATDDFRGFPPSLLLLGNVDPARDEGLELAHRLVHTGSEVELHLVPGAPHGFDLVESARATQLSLDLRIAALKRAFGAA